MTYLDPFLGPKIGTLYITDYKMYFSVSLLLNEGLCSGTLNNSVLAKEWYSGGAPLFPRKNTIDVVRRMCQNHKYA